MVNSKMAVLLIVAAVLVAVVAGIAFAQYASAQANASRTYPSQIPQTSGSYYQYPQQGYYPYGQQFSGPFGAGGMGMGMCGRSR